MDIERKLELIKGPPTEEIITENELRQLLETKETPVHYMGFEISGLLHLGTLVLSGSKINDFIKAGCKATVWLADWHSFINKKLEGNWEKIKIAARYYEEAFKFITDGKAKILLGSDIYHNNDEFWKDLIFVSQKSTLKRTIRCLQIMGRKENDALDMAQFYYPAMQAADMRILCIDVAHAGMDQRKVHMLAREVFPKLDWKPPIALHHHLLPGLAGPVILGFDKDKKLDQVISSKMSKSKPWTCIFVHDTKKQIEDKLKKAWCPERVTDANPILEMIKFIVFKELKTFKLERLEKYGGSIEFDNYQKLEDEYRAGEIHPLDLKKSLAEALDKIIKPIRGHFEKPANAKLLDVYKGTKTTR